MTQPLYCIRCEEMVDLVGGTPFAHEYSVYMGQDQPPEFGFCEFPDGYASCQPPEFDMDAWLEAAEPPSDELDYTE